MLRRLITRTLFGRQIDRFNRWRNLSPAGLAFWAVRKAVLWVIVFAILAVLLVNYHHPESVMGVVNGTESPTSLLWLALGRPLELGGMALVSAFAVFVPWQPDRGNNPY